MPDKSQQSRFSETIPLGIVAVILGVSSVSLSSRIPAIAFLLAVAGVLFGFLTFKDKTKADKLNKSMAVLGILLAFGNLVFILIAMVNK